MGKQAAGESGSGGAGAQSGVGSGAVIPIWHSRLYQQRRAHTLAHRMSEERLRRFADGTLLREKRAFAEHLLDLCDRAERVLLQRGGDIGPDLECIQDLQLMVSTLDAEGGMNADLERIEQMRSYLEAMVLAIEVARVAGSLPARA